jgi:cytoskeleton protein RodZ
VLGVIPANTPTPPPAVAAPAAAAPAEALRDPAPATPPPVAATTPDPAPAPEPVTPPPVAAVPIVPPATVAPAPAMPAPAMPAPEPEVAAVEPAPASEPVAVVEVLPTLTPAPAPAPEPIVTPPAILAPPPAVAAAEPPPAAQPIVPPAAPVDLAVAAREGQVYGAASGRVVVLAHQDSWVQVTGAAGELLLTRILRAGDKYIAPAREDLVMMTGNAGALEVSVDGKVIPPLGPPGTVRRNVSLSAEKLRAGTAVQP